MGSRDHFYEGPPVGGGFVTEVRGCGVRDSLMDLEGGNTTLEDCV